MHLSSAPYARWHTQWQTDGGFALTCFECYQSLAGDGFVGLGLARIVVLCVLVGDRPRRVSDLLAVLSRPGLLAREGSGAGQGGQSSAWAVP